ncbi:hypothetical protein RI129_004323 [Pyrocoelia pectoralis]|uniref:Uncharacterized protein n=1 Tax=Pyrocoelia pectoralis TaxID=417401 RepID=A0AAN7VL76_9COLE
MKIFVVFVCLAGLAAADPQDDDVQLSKADLLPIEELFDKFVALLKRFDPVHIESETFFDIFGMYLRVEHLHAEGFSNIISDFAVNTVYPEIEVKIKLSLPHIFASVESFDVSTPIIFGQGNASFSLKKGTGSITIVYSFEDGFKPPVIVASAESFNVDIVGLNNHAELRETISRTSKFLYNMFGIPKIIQHVQHLIDTVKYFLAGPPTPVTAPSTTGP